MSIELEQSVKSADLKQTRDVTNQLQEYDNHIKKCHDSFFYDVKTNFRLYRKKISTFIRKYKKKTFREILLVTTVEPACDFIMALQNQYPENSVSILIPILGDFPPVEKSLFSFEYYCQNKIQNANVYKLQKNYNNINVYGIFSSAFSNIENINLFNDIKYLSPYTKCARECVRRLKPDIVQSSYLPFYLGSEFDRKINLKAKVFQTVADFLDYDNIEPFWALINIADKSGMKKICRDKIIQKCIATLFNQHNTEHFTQMRDCLDFIYKNYISFRTTINRNEENMENAVFKRLNFQILKLFPKVFPENSLNYNSIYTTLKKADYVGVLSDSYYKNILTNESLSNSLDKTIQACSYKMTSILIGYDTIQDKIYQPFRVENFRELRIKNKNYLLKELSNERIKTKFYDKTLFDGEEPEIYGYLASFYEAPVILAVFDNNHLLEKGADIAITTVLKLFELNKNFKFILNIPNGYSDIYIKNFIDFLKSKPLFNGRWVFINNTINVSRFTAGSDIVMIPNRTNIQTQLPYIAIKNGCVPIVSGSGLLNDIVTDIFEDIANGCGFKTEEPLTLSENPNEEYLKTVLKGLSLYQQNQGSWNQIIKNCLKSEIGWSFDVIAKYNQIYEELV